MKDECLKNGWVRLYRCIMDSGVWKNANYLKVFLWCLLKANHEDNEFPFNGKDIVVKRGSFITGQKSALRELRPLSLSTLKSATAYLKSTCRIEQQTNNRFTIITVCNYDIYQPLINTIEPQNRITNEYLTNNKRITNEHKQEYKNDKNDKNTGGEENGNEDGNEDVIKKRKREPFKIPSIEEVRKFFSDNGYDPDFGETRWHYYNDADWFDSHGDPVLSWKQKMRSVWFKDEHLIKPKEVTYKYGTPGFDPKTVI